MATNMAPQEALPLPVQQAAAALRLGAFTKVYKVSARRTIVGASIILAAAVFFSGGGIFPQNISDSTRTTLIVCGLAFLGIAFYMFYTVVQVRNQQIYLFQQGIVIEKGGRVEVFPWSQAAQVLQSITRNYRNGVYVGTTYIYTLQRADGYQIKLDNLTKEVAELGQSVAQGIARELIPRAFQALQYGQTLPFGTFSLNQQGISNKGDFIPWQQVQAVEVKQGKISIKKVGAKRAWGSTMVAKTPNFLVFTVVTEKMIRQASSVRQG